MLISAIDFDVHPAGINVSMYCALMRTVLLQCRITKITLALRNINSQFFKYMYRASFIIFYYDQQMHNHFTNYPTPTTCFDSTVSSSGSLYSTTCQVTQVFQMQLLVNNLQLRCFARVLCTFSY